MTSIVPNSERVLPPECGAPEGRSDFAAGLIVYPFELAHQAGTDQHFRDAPGRLLFLDMKALN